MGDTCSINQTINVQMVSARTGDAILNVETGACRTSQETAPAPWVPWRISPTFPTWRTCSCMT